MPASLPENLKVYLRKELIKLRQVMRWELGHIDIRDPTREAFLRETPDLDLPDIPMELRTYLANEQMKLRMLIRWELGRFEGCDGPACEARPTAESLSRSNVADMIQEHIGFEMTKFSKAFRAEMSEFESRVDNTAKENRKELEDETRRCERNMSMMLQYTKTTTERVDRERREQHELDLDVLHATAIDEIARIRTSTNNFPTALTKKAFRDREKYLDHLSNERVPYDVQGSGNGRVQRYLPVGNNTAGQGMADKYLAEEGTAEKGTTKENDSAPSNDD
jgi:hypothetical protein